MSKKVKLDNRPPYKSKCDCNPSLRFRYSRTWLAHALFDCPKWHMAGEATAMALAEYKRLGGTRTR